MQIEVEPGSLKRCPFCGSMNINIIKRKCYTYVYYKIGCNECAINTASYETEQEAINFWNKRVNDV